jgi:16S rRNA pseudouridine516 synthase
MLNKPDGYVSATEDGREKTVLDLLPEKLQKLSLFPCGRLDKHTLGLMLLTNDGQLAHDLLSPRHHVEKNYRFSVKFPLTDEEVATLEQGTVLEDGYETKPSRIRLDEGRKSGTIMLVEGKYHQIKRMMESVHNQITALERISFGPLTLDPTLSRGEFRYLTETEEAALQALRRGTPKQ